MMRTTLFVIITFLFACSQGTTDLDMPSADSGVPCNAGDWWCVDGADAGTMSVDAGGNGNGKDPGLGAGWYGEINDTSAVFGFNQYDGKTKTCELVYELQNVVELSDCMDCQFAKSANLGSVNIVLDQGGCGAAAMRAGETIKYGHGQQGADNKPPALYTYDEMKWSIVDGATSTYGTNQEWTFFIPEKGNNNMNKPGTHLEWSGELNTTTQQGFYRFRSIDDNGQTADCDISFAITSAMLTQACPSSTCDFAWDMVLGTSTTAVSGAGCENEKRSTGDTLSMGHRAPSQLVFGKQGTWNDFGMSSVNGETWSFIAVY